MSSIYDDPARKILLDCDVVRHFMKGEQASILGQLFPNRLVFLDVVLQELMRSHQLQTFTERLIKLLNIQIIKIEIDSLDVYREFAQLKKQFGDGESACMAYAKYNADIIASSNLRDIKKYCNQNKIAYLTTIDILNIAYCRNIMNAVEIDVFIKKVISSGSKLPVHNFDEFIELVSI